jgi:hypothetical protein
MLGKARVPCLLHHYALEGEAFYRVVDATGRHVEVEVVSAPGLEPGQRLRFTQRAVARMSVIEESAGARAPGSGGASAEPTATLPVQPTH